MRFLILLLAMASQASFAACYVVGDLKGYSSRGADNFELDADGYSGQKFMVDLSPDRASITPHDMDCTLAGIGTLLCFDRTEQGQLTFETWAIYPELGRAIHTKTINGYGQFDGGNLFVGEVKGRCDD